MPSVISILKIDRLNMTVCNGTDRQIDLAHTLRKHPTHMLAEFGTMSIPGRIV